MTKKKKVALTYAIMPSMQGKIRDYVNHIHAITGRSKSHIVSTILMDAVDSICQNSSKSSNCETEEQQ